MQQTRTHRFPLPIIYPTSGTHRNTESIYYTTRKNKHTTSKQQ
nr:unnamed protein product [Callosobruchus analis]CAI5831136.1 unnamed protein product [Callosobruchus analis]